MTETAIRPDQRILPTTVDPWAESLLERRQLGYEKRKISFRSIDHEASLRNQARTVPLSAEVVDLYAVAMEAGEEFPAIVVSGIGPKLIVLDGNHRMTAAERVGFTHIEAYVVTNASRAQVELFTYEANTRHGLPTSLAERIRQGIYLVSMGNTIKDVSNILSLNENSFRTEVSVVRQRQRLAELGLPVERLNKSFLNRAGSVRNDHVVVELAKLATEVGMGTDPLGDLVTRLNHLGTEEAQLRFISDERKRYGPLLRSTAGGRLSLPRNVNRIQMAIRLVDNIDTTELPVQLNGLDVEYRKLLARDSAAAVQKFVEVLAALRKVTGGE